MVRIIYEATSGVRTLYVPCSPGLWEELSEQDDRTFSSTDTVYTEEEMQQLDDRASIKPFKF